MELLNTFTERSNDWLIALGEHLQLSLIAILVAILIAVPLAVILSQSKRLAEGVLQLTGILQTIPSLALLGLFIPIMGIGTLPAVVALSIYAIFPILQNTITGFNQIDPQLEEAAEAFGMTRFEKLKKYQMELALPVIISGIRTSTVLVIGTATLAALIGAGGMGSFILLGIDRNNMALIVIGAISSALLAVIFNTLIKRMERMELKQMVLIMGVLSIGLFVSFQPWTSNRQQDTVITVAGKLGPEPEILSNMYQLLIEDQSNLQVDLKPNFGKTTFLYEAVKSGDIDVYTEFTGTITSALLNHPPEPSNDPREVYEAAKKGVQIEANLVLLEPMAYQNTYAIAVQRDFAEANDLKNISDLRRVQNTAKAGFTLEFNDREDGALGLRDVYGLNFEVVTLEPSLRYPAIVTGEVQLIEAFSTDSEIIEYDLVLLNDDRNLFPPYQGAPLVNGKTLDKHPELAPILNQLAGKITEEEMAQMNYEVKVNGESAHNVAKKYLEKNGLIGR